MKSLMGAKGQGQGEPPSRSSPPLLRTRKKNESEGEGAGALGLTRSSAWLRRRILPRVQPAPGVRSPEPGPALPLPSCFHRHHQVPSNLGALRFLL